MIVFWVAAGVLSAAAAGLILSRAARAASPGPSSGEARDPTSTLYRRQLAEIDELAERGLMGEAERRSAHAEAGRRLLAAADAPAEAWTADPAARRGVLAAVIAAPALALGIYLQLGSPGMADQPFAARMKGWLASSPAELPPPELAAVLKTLIAQRAPDPEGYRLLAIAENASQNPPETIRALRHALKLAPGRADLWEMLGEAQVAEADGKLSDDAKASFQHAVQRDPKGSVLARFSLAGGRIEAGDKPGGLADWRALMAELPADDPRRAAIAQQIAEQEGRAEPTPAPGGGQMDMIRGMVEGLAQRLKANPDSPDGWVKLVRAYAVLGEAGKRDAALASARARYAAKPEVMRDLDAAAKAEPMK
jgi:cytochrome c-type biogenesis protein CcmH